MKFHITKKSTNVKTGKIPVTTSPEATCPGSCPLKTNGCYAEGGPLAIHWRKVSTGVRGIDWASFTEQIASLPEGQLWRHNQSGDLVGKNNRINTTKLRQLMVANTGKRGFTYTHYPVDQTCKGRHNANAVFMANAGGFTINLSADSVEEADELAKLKIGPVCTTLPSDTNVTSFKTPDGNTVLVCPATVPNSKLKSCEQCKLCSVPTRQSIIGFPAHGFKKSSVDNRMQA